MSKKVLSIFRKKTFKKSKKRSRERDRKKELKAQTIGLFLWSERGCDIKCLINSAINSIEKEYISKANHIGISDINCIKINF